MPGRFSPGIGDIFPAALSAFGLLAAVRHADATGQGQLVDVAMYDAVLALTERIVYQHSITGTSPVPQGNTHPLLCPYGPRVGIGRAGRGDDGASRLRP